ncbi:MAG: DUF5060 domain-containing protein, partial [Planctomycetota bacterium]
MHHHQLRLNTAFTASFLFIILPAVAWSQNATTAEPVVFAEKDGLVAVEAEHYFKQTQIETRAFHLTTESNTPDINPDGDPNHVGGASGGAYLEILPDTRRNHGHKLIHGTNFSPEPGKLAVLHYRVNFDKPGKYYVWVRAYSTGSEDNGLHVGIDGTWPESGQRLQWCQGKNTWRWESKQRTAKNHCGEPHKIFIDVQEPGEHTIHFSMREDGFEFDKWLMTTDREFKRPAGVGPESQVFAGTPPKTFPFVKPPVKSVAEVEQAKPAGEKALLMTAKMFSQGKNRNYYLDRNDQWMAVNPDKHKDGSASRTFPYPTGVYNVTLRAVGENDGQSTYDLKIDDTAVGEFKCPPSTQMFEEGKAFSKTWKNVQVTEGAIISVGSKVGSNDGQEYSRARWAAVAFEPANAATMKAAQPMLAQQATKRAKPNKATAKSSPTVPVSKKPLIEPRQPNGDGSVTVDGELKTWHKVTINLNGPYAHEQDNEPNPFTDYRMQVEFTHASGKKYVVPGYFAADGNANNSSAESGIVWRAHFAPDKTGEWTYQVTFRQGKLAARIQSTLRRTVSYHFNTVLLDEWVHYS